MQIEQLQPTPIDNSRYIWAVHKTLDKDKTGYSMFCLTDESGELDGIFGLDFRNPGEVSEESLSKLRLATTFMGESYETVKVASYFAKFAENFNHFIALPADEIYQATNGEITDHDVMRATEEGYIRRTVFSETDVELVELTSKFGWMFKLASELASDEKSLSTEE